MGVDTVDYESCADNGSLVILAQRMADAEAKRGVWILGALVFTLGCCTLK